METGDRALRRVLRRVGTAQKTRIVTNANLNKPAFLIFAICITFSLCFQTELLIEFR